MAPSRINLESVENVSLLRKFSVVYMLSSVFPLVVLFLVYLFMQMGKMSFVLTIPSSLYLVALFGLICFFLMRRSLSQLHIVSSEFQSSIKEAVPREINIPFLGNSEVATIVNAFNALVKRLEANIAELEKSRHMLLQALEREQMLASTDNLTGLANRRVFYELTGMEIQKSRRYNRPFSVLLMDVDNFKTVNDTMGHQRGDDLLITIGKGIRESVRTCDVAARLGGDEFAILLSEAGIETFETVIPRIRGKLKEYMQQEEWPVTFSMGVAAFKVPPENVDEIMRRVDSLMYSIKREGKDNIKFETVS
ncbi:MAG: GGDEF domain-containing protein [Deltaproteobacteria bacterium]